MFETIAVQARRLRKSPEQGGPDLMLAALNEIAILRARANAEDATDDETNDAVDRISELEKVVASSRAGSPAGALAALREARREWEAFHADPGAPGHDVMSALLAAVDVLEPTHCDVRP